MCGLENSFKIRTSLLVNCTEEGDTLDVEGGRQGGSAGWGVLRRAGDGVLGDAKEY